jgi:TRAP-type C4-dicarboxylate transport system permease large subunit
VPQASAQLIAALDLGPISLILLIGAFYLVVGMFLDGLSIMVMTLPITLPLIVAAGWDPVWFGVFLVIAIELGLITPPVGFNLFVIQGMTGKPITQIARAAIPFFLLMILAALLLIAFPQIALFVPEVLF